tara:strand:+ start:7717 stop:8715 length:999 start_codon:yes stop_codon:yes gene_type:complete
MSILVTGGCGFIGSNFINRIYIDYPNLAIVNVDKISYCSNKKRIDAEIRQDAKRYALYEENINNYEKIFEILNTHEVAFVVHFAAQSHVQNSFADSLHFTEDNVKGTHTLLEACRLYGKIKKFIHCSTDEVYGETPLGNNQQKLETSMMCPTNPYAATKAGAELIATSYFYSYKMPICITRGNNVYGPHQFPEKVIPLFVTRLLNGTNVNIQGSGSATRGFLYIDDVVNAFITIFDKGEPGQVYNIGCEEGNEITIKDLALTLGKLIFPASDEQFLDKKIHFIEDRPFNDHRYYISSDKLKNLGWNSATPLSEGLKKTIDFYKNIIDSGNIP